MRRLHSIAGLVALLMTLTACAGAKKVKAGQHVVEMPPHCSVVDKFYKPCPPARGGGFDCHVHVRVKASHECNQYNTRDLLHVTP